MNIANQGIPMGPLTRLENLVVAKLWQKGVKNLDNLELTYALEAVGRPAYCKNVALQLIKRGLTIDGLYRMFNSEAYEGQPPHIFSS